MGSYFFRTRTSSDHYRASPLTLSIEEHTPNLEILNDLLNGEGDEISLFVLEETERNRQVLIFQKIVEAVVSNPFEHPIDSNASLAILQEAERCSPENVAEVLLFPSVTFWMADTLKSLVDWFNDNKHQHELETQR